MKTRIIIPLVLLTLVGLCACDGDGDGGEGATTTSTTTGGGSTTTSLATNATTTTTASAATTTIGGPGTTMTSTTTSTLAATPTTTLEDGDGDTCPGDPQATCVVTLRVINTVTLGGLQLEVDYRDVAGCFVGIGDMVDCTDVVGALSTFNDDDLSHTLRAAFVSVGGIEAPTAVAECTFQPAVTPVDTSAFKVTVVDAVTPDLVTAEARVIAEARCTNGTSSTTTTSLPAVTTTSTTTTMPGSATEFDVTLRLVDQVTVGGLELVVDYSNAPGEFRGTGATIGEGGTLECESLVAGGLTQFNDDDMGRLRMGLISTGGILGPVDLASCIFDREAAGMLNREDFTVRVDDAIDPNIEPILPLPEVSVSVSER